MKTVPTYSSLLMVLFLILFLKPHCLNLKVPNLPKIPENQIGSAGENPEDEHDETKLSRFKLRLNNLFICFSFFNVDTFSSTTLLAKIDSKLQNSLLCK